MANHAHSTRTSRTPLLPLAGALPPLLPRGAAKQVGPVTAAIRAVRRDEPPLPPEWLADLAAGRDALAEVRRRIEDRIEFDLALLDALDGNSDREDGGDAEPSLGSVDAASHSDRMSQLRWSIGGVDDRELGDDNGIADSGGEAEQACRHIALGGDCSVSWRRFA